MADYGRLKKYIDEYVLREVALGERRNGQLLKDDMVDGSIYEFAELWYYGDSDEFEPIIVVDAKVVIEDYLKLDKQLTREIQSEHEFGLYKWGIDWVEEWVKNRGYEIGWLGIGNTYNWGVNVSVFMFLHFIDDRGRDCLAVMWHRGGDVRGNYSKPEIWVGDVEEFFSAISVEDEYEMADLLGYSDFDELERVLREWMDEIRREGGDMGEGRRLIRKRLFRER